MSAVPLFFIILWFSRFGRFKFAEDDFQKAKREMRKSLFLWLGILVVQLIVVLTPPAIEPSACSGRGCVLVSSSFEIKVE